MNLIETIPTWCWAIMGFFAFLALCFKLGWVLVSLVQLLWHIAPIIFIPLISIAAYLYWQNHLEPYFKSKEAERVHSNPIEQ